MIGVPGHWAFKSRPIPERSIYADKFFTATHVGFPVILALSDRAGFNFRTNFQVGDHYPALKLHEVPWLDFMPVEQDEGGAKDFLSWSHATPTNPERQPILFDMAEEGKKMGGMKETPSPGIEVGHLEEANWN